MELLGVLQEQAIFGDSKNLFLASVAKGKMKTKKCLRGWYIDTLFLLPTSNERERLYSAARGACGDYQKSMSSLHFELLMFSHANGDTWNVSDINEMVG